MRKTQSKLENLDEARIREIFRYLICIKNDGRPVDFLSEDNLKYEIIKLIKCDVKTTSHIINKMEKLGLSVCTSLDDYWNVLGPRTYEIIRFARMRGYVTEEEIEDYHERQEKYEKMMEEYEKESYTRRKNES